MKEKILFENKTKTITSIANKFCIPRSTVSAWFHGRQPIYKFCIGKHYRETFDKKIPKSSKSLTANKSYLLGVICGDGYVNYKGYYISLETVTENFIRKFQESLISVYGKDFCGTIKPTCRGKKRIIVCGKEMTEDIRKYLPVKGSFCWRIPKEIMKGSKKHKISFLQGFFDSEGSVHEKYSIEMFSSNKKGLIDIKNLLNSLEIKTSKIRCRTKNRYVVYITGKENIVKFINMVGTNIPNRLNRMRNLLLRYGLNPTLAQSN